jgi:hypothetical protein
MTNRINFPTFVNFTAPKEIITPETSGFSIIVCQPTGDNKPSATQSGRLGLLRPEPLESGASLQVHYYIFGEGTYTPI